MSGFSNQGGPQSRAAPSGSGRLQNKGGNAAGWGFTMQNTSAPGLAAPQARGPGASSFAQTIGNSQSPTPLDPSEFPSLSGGPQQQYQNPGHAVWSNQRNTQQNSIGRPQPQPTNVIGSAQSQQPSQEHAQQNLDEAFFSSSMNNGSLDDYRHGGQGGVGQLSGSGQPPSGSIDDFPPLGRLGHGDIGQDRRAAMMQNAAGGAFPGSSHYNIAGLRGGGDPLRQDNGKNGQLLSNGRGPFSNEASPPPLLPMEDPNNQSNMSEIDRYGIKSLLNAIRSQNSEAGSLAIGQNLNTLGLELESPDPLHPSFAGPFASAPTRHLQPDYQLPQCYSVGNTHPVEEKLGGLIDDTLLWIFYNLPRDVMQEQSAMELTERNWRFHKALGVWLTKDPGSPEPTLIAHEVERGRYIVFNHRTWAREVREMIIRYSDLDDHLTHGAGAQRSSIVHA